MAPMEHGDVILDTACTDNTEGNEEILAGQLNVAASVFDQTVGYLEDIMINDLVWRLFPDDLSSLLFDSDGFGQQLSYGGGLREVVARREPLGEFKLRQLEFKVLAKLLRVVFDCSSYFVRDNYHGIRSADGTWGFVTA
ncbi:hypothetical protein FGIG_08464 [Fasciola gigantica]|uniref:Uncharacterized protein n=1 Tax=Fasciola gigantica TaxID=46835 RepID=A0A504YNP0_FASGI|nr:hypothetical protein FGIG_08464 [Fasciola gigantica]